MDAGDERAGAHQVDAVVEHGAAEGPHDGWGRFGQRGAGAAEGVPVPGEAVVRAGEFRAEDEVDH